MWHGACQVQNALSLEKDLRFSNFCTYRGISTEKFGGGDKAWGKAWPVAEGTISIVGWHVEEEEYKLVCVWQW